MDWDSNRRKVIDYFIQADLETKEYIRAAFAIDIGMMDIMIAEEKTEGADKYE